MKQYTLYQQRFRKCFSNAYGFLDRHQCPRTEADWQSIAEELAQYTDPLTVGLIVAVVEELEREAAGKIIKERNHGKNI